MMQRDSNNNAANNELRGSAYAITATLLDINIGPRQLLSQLNVSVKSGELLCVIGANGAGKSTLLHALAGEKALEAGEVLFANQCINTAVKQGLSAIEPMQKAKLNGRTLSWFSVFEQSDLAQRMAVLPQHNHLNFPFSVEEVILFGRTPHRSGRQIDEYIVKKIAEQLDIASLLERPFTALSGGEKQRTHIARVLAQICCDTDFSESPQDFNSSPRVLLLDEPLASLDLGHQQDVMRVVKQFTGRGVSVVMVVHDMNIAAQHADTVLALADGKTIAYGQPQSVINAELLREMFGVDVSVVPHPVSGKPVVMPLGT